MGSTIWSCCSQTWPLPFPALIQGWKMPSPVPCTKRTFILPEKNRIGKVEMAEQKTLKDEPIERSGPAVV